MLRTIVVAGLSWTAMLTGCAADTTTLDTAAQDRPAEQADAPHAFEVRLRDDTTAERAIPAILAAGHDQLVTACEQTPGASVRIINPLASGDYADIACSSILDGTGQTREALTSEPTGESRQKLTPVGPLLCGLLGLIETTATAKACSDWRGPNSQFCSVGGFFNGAAWLWACAIMF